MSIDPVEKKRRRSPAVFLLLACCFPALPAAAAAENADSFTLERYQVLSERNIYLRDRAPRPEPVRTSILRDTPPPVYRVQATLTGVVQHGEHFTAFFEDTITHRTTRVRAGDAFLQGQVESITLDRVTHNRNGLSQSVGLGEYLELVSSTPLRSETANAAASPAVSSTPAPGLGSSLLEQLRLRRQRELEGQ